MNNHSVPFNLIPEALQNIAAQCLADVISSSGVSGGDQEAAKAIGKAFIALYLSEVEEHLDEESASEPITSTLQERIDKFVNATKAGKFQACSR